MNDADQVFLASLGGPAQAYAAAYGEHLSCGDRAPVAAEFNLDGELAGKIRAVLVREWERRLHANPVLSGRRRVRRLERGRGGS